MNAATNITQAEGTYEYLCGRHCKLCPFPGFKCNGRPTKLNYEDPESSFTKLYMSQTDDKDPNKKRI